MKRASLAKPVSLLLLLVACGTPAPDVAGPSAALSAAPEPAPEPAPEAVERLRSDVEWLADDAREGRRSGERGERIAAEWIAARLAELGLEAAGDGGYLQELEVPLPARDGGGSTLSVEGASLPAAPLFCSGSGTAEGVVVDVGYGIVFEERDHDDYADRDVQGAVCLIRRGTPEVDEPAEEEEAVENPHGAAASSSSSWGGSGSIFHKVMQAKRRGAVAVVLGPRNANEPPLTFDPGRTAEAGLPALAVSWDAYQELAQAARREAGARLSADVVRARGTATNVLGRVPGRGQAATVVVGAHFDHLGHGGIGSLAKDAYGQVHNGADDNASGTAAVLEIGRRLAQGPPPAGDIVLALWSGEELGLLGSEHWGQNPTVPLEEISANVNLDMVGRAGNGSLQVLGVGTGEEFRGWLESVGPGVGLDLKLNSSGRGLGGSDHQTFLKREIPALHFFSGVHTDYHRPSDDVERFEAEGAARVVDLTLALVDLIQGVDHLVYVEPQADEEEDRGSSAGGFRTRFGSVPEYSYEGEGLLLAGTSPGGPAERAGLLKDDLILALDDIEIGSIYDFMFALNAHKPGDVVQVRYEREGEERHVRVTLDSPDLE